MPLHDYSISNYTSLLSSIHSARTSVDDAILSIEAQANECNFSMLNDIIQYAEVKYILSQKEELQILFSKGEERLIKTAAFIGRIDSGKASEIDASLSALQQIITGVGSTTGLLSSYVSVAEPHTWVCDKKAKIYKLDKYVTYNSETGKYEYNWSSLAMDLQNGSMSSGESSEAITELLYTMIDDNNNIDTDNLETYLKILASNGHCCASLNKPDESEASYLQLLADALEPTNSYYVAAIQQADSGSPERDALVARLSMNNIVITASKTVKTTIYTEDFSSYTKYQKSSSSTPNTIYAPGTLFVGNDGVLYNVTQMQPAPQWVKSDKTAQQLQAEGKPYQIRGNIQTGGDVYELKMPGQKTLYRTDVSLSIKQEAASYKDESGNVHKNADCNCYTITSNKTLGIVIDYTTDTRTAVNCFEDKYNEYAKRYQISQIASLKKEEKTVEEAVHDKAMKKIDKDLQKTVKKYSIKLITEFIPGFDTAESVVEDIVTNTYGVYKDQKEVEEWNSNVDTIISNCSKLYDNYLVIDRTGDSIVELNTDGVAITTIYDDNNVSINIQ